MGSGEKTEKQKRSETMYVRITLAQREMFLRAAEAAGITMSAWAAERLTRAAKSELAGEKL